MAEAKRDQNQIVTLMGVTDDGNLTPVNLVVDPTTGRLKVSAVISTGSLTSLNGLSAATQLFAVGTTGDDFNIASLTDTHTFNLPTASATKRGALSSADWSTFNGKQAALGFTPENVANLRTSFQVTPDDTHYPSEKLVKDSLDGKSDTSHNHTGVYAPALGADDNYVTDAEKTVIGNTSGTNTGDSATPAETATTIGALIGGAGDATPNDTDFVATSLTAAGILKKITWTNVKAFLKTYFDTLYLALGGGTLTGEVNLGENAGLVIDTALSADGKYSGIIENGTAGAALAFGDLVYLAAADSRWELTDANADATAGAVKLGICVLAAAGDGNATKVLLWGKVRADTAFPALTISAPVYIGEVAGDIVVTQPSTADVIIRKIGFGNTADELFFCPSNDYIVHT